jgi:hypothetical protein
VITWASYGLAPGEDEKRGDPREDESFEKVKRLSDDAQAQKDITLLGKSRVIE